MNRVNRLTDRLVDTPAFLLLCAVVAWFPSIHEYHYLADDFAMARGMMEHLGVWGFIVQYYREFGLWRILGHTMVMWIAMVGQGTLFPPIIFLLIHAANGMVLKALLNRMGITRQGALLWSIVYVVVPFGIQALLWASAFTYVISTSAIMLLVSFLYAPPKAILFHGLAHCAVLFAIACALVFSNEALLIPAAICGVPLALRRITNMNDGSKGDWLSPLTPCFAVVVASFAIKLSLPVGVREANIQPQAMASALLYQVTDVMYFGIILSREAWGYLLSVASWPVMIGLISSFAGLLWFLLVRMKSTVVSSKAEIDESLLRWLSVGLICTGAVHALGGGYSLDSRKRYPFVGIIVALLAVLCERYWVKRFSRSSINSCLCLVIALSIATTWLWAATWEVQSRRDAFIDRVRSEKRSKPVRLTIHTGEAGGIGVPYASTVVPNLEPVVDYESLRWNIKCYREIELKIRYSDSEWGLASKDQAYDARKVTCEEAR
ncbi:MAG: hypothetical protein ABL995_19065 [Bryobacteraceae bacterium]